MALPTTYTQADTSPDKSANSYYEDALKRYHDKQYDEAVIQIKNALQQNPRLLPALVLLGQTYLARGDSPAAEAAFIDAQQLGADPNLIAIPLAESLVSQFKHQKLLEQPLPSVSDETLGKLLILRAQAALEIGNKPALATALEQAEALAPDALGLLSIKATNAMLNGELDKASQWAQQMLSLYPNEADSWLLDASLKHLQGDFDGALQGYQQVLNLAPDRGDTRIAKISLLIDLRREAETSEDFSKLNSTHGADPRVAYLKSIKFAREGDEHGSRQALNKALNGIEFLGADIVSNNQQLLLIAAIAHSALGNKDLATKNFERYVEIGGQETIALKSLAKIYISKGQHSNAVELLENLMDRSHRTPDIISLLARAYQGVGQHQVAINLLERANTGPQYSPQLKTQLAISRLQAGNITQGMQDLDNMFQTPATTQLAGMPLALMLLNQGKFEAAHDTAKTLLDSEPNNPTYINLLAIAKTSTGDSSGARALFEKLLALDNTATAAQINLAKLDAGDGNYPAAIKRLTDVLQQDAENSQVMLELSRLYQAQSKPKEGLKWAYQAAAAAPESFTAKKHLVEYLIASDELTEAEKIATEQAVKHESNLFAQELQFKVLSAQKRFKIAGSHLIKMSKLAESNSEWLVKIARYQLDIDDPEQATYTLFKALQNDPKQLEPRVLLTQIELQLGRFPQAEKNAATILADHPDAAIGHQLTGDLHMQQANYQQAITHYRQSLVLAAATETVLRIHLAQRRSGDAGASETTLTEWLDHYPQDMTAINALAEFYIAQQDFNQARVWYEKLIADQPEHPYLNNNLANIHFKLGQLNEAITYATRAHRLLPQNPMINDTLGWVLINQGRSEDGLAYLREALIRSSNNPEIRYHLAVGLHKLGRNQEALRELNRALHQSPNNPQARFASRQQAEALKATLVESL